MPSKLLALGLLAAVAAWAAPRTTLDGVFTQEQADRGRTVYARGCARCHQADLNGTGGAPALHTSTFTENWREGYLSNLFHHIQTWMPPQDLKGTLPEQAYIDVTAYILSANEFPAGPKELTKAELNTILFVDLSGAQPLPPATTVRIVGCLARDRDWTLTKVGEVPRVRDGADTYPEEIGWSQTVPLGSKTVRLPTIEEDRKPADLLPQVGKKVQVKGVLNGQEPNLRITVFSLETLDSDSGPKCGN